MGAGQWYRESVGWMKGSLRALLIDTGLPGTPRADSAAPDRMDRRATLPFDTDIAPMPPSVVQFPCPGQPSSLVGLP